MLAALGRLRVGDQRADGPLLGPLPLVITLDTVKKHVSHVLGKLDAANRTEAVTRARELSLIP